MSGLQLCTDEAVPELRRMTVSHLAWLAREGRIRTNRWQRPPRWNDDDRCSWALRVCQGKADILALHQTAGDAAGDELYFVVDGQNRIDTLRLLLADSILLPTHDLLREPDLVAASTITLSGLRAMSPHTAADVETRQLYVLVYPPQTTQHQLRRVFYDNNQGKHMTSQELIHSWDFLPLVRDIITPANERFKAAFGKLSSRWRVRQCGLVHTLVRIVATIANGQVHLCSTLAVESWAAHFTPDVVAINAVVVQVLEDTLLILNGWRTCRVMCGLHAVPDVAWFVWRLRCTAPALLDTETPQVAELLFNALNQAQGEGKTLFDNFWRRPLPTYEHVEIRRRQLAAAAVTAGLWSHEPDVVYCAWMEPLVDDFATTSEVRSDDEGDITEDEDSCSSNAFAALVRLWRPPSPNT
jgi:hypothetical protein